MRIHTDTLTMSDVHHAARTARVTLDTLAQYGSRSRDHAFEVILSGESRRNQNGGSNKAATWDQWGVFLGMLFSMDGKMTVPRVYDHAGIFGYKTDHRFSTPGAFPADYHGDHKFEYAGVPFSQSCTKCSASYRWQ